MKIYTRRGDDGSTGLMFGARVYKDDPRTQAVGTTDEAVAVLGLAKAYGLSSSEMVSLIERLQRELFVVGAQLATPSDEAHRLEDATSRVTAEMVASLEEEIDRCVAKQPLPDYFVLPGSTPASASLDLARSVVRRAERHVVTMQRQGLKVQNEMLEYLNRFSDLLFVLARIEEGAAGHSAIPSREKTARLTRTHSQSE